MVTKRQAKALAEKRAALASQVSVMTDPNPETLSRSYGLPVPEVERIIRSIQYG